MANAEGKTIKIRQVRSGIGTKKGHREVLRSLGLRRLHHEVERADTPAVRGMVKKVEYLLEVEES
ncbi:MAG TPA: 50S ribosomal protein L30 [Thermoanaerobaculia bacterium]|nr:50S ribosomal protein L30 [Thermoanaerobaculia bacterium]